MLMLLNVLLVFSTVISGKYLEGELKTNDNWAFLARFCFLSEEGEYEYHIEYNDDQGDLKLLLYYDTEDQWNAVYKTNKTCSERESVLHIEQNQIVNLTAKHPYSEFSGCYYAPILKTTPTKKYTINIPTITYKTRRTKTPTTPIPKTTPLTTETTPATTETTTTMIMNETEQPTTFFPLINQSETPSEYFSFTTDEILTETMTKEAPIKKRSVVTSLPFKGSKLIRRIVCHNARRFRSSRERWWFIAVSNCNGTKGIQMKYKILMTNGPTDDYWHHHFSADEFYVLPILMTFTLAYSFLILCIIVCTIELKSRQLLHSTYKLFVFSVIIQLFGILLQAMAYLKYAINGMGFPKLKMVGEIFMGASETCFLLLLLLLAKGYTITRGRLPVAASIKLTVFMCIYVTTYLSLFIYETKVFDPGEVLYLYESPAGYGLIVLRVLAWFMFIYSTIFTLKHYPEKSNFYYPFNICGTLWCIAGPAFILSANTYIDKWVRESVVCGVLLFIAFGGHMMFLILTMPSVANKNFPYHVRTSQIGVMELTGMAGSNAIDQFSHHVYEPTAVAETVIIPLTRRTEEMFENMYVQRLPRASFRNGASLTPELQANTAMDNVMAWSLAKNVPAIEIGHFERVNRSNEGSSNSRSSANPSESNSQRQSLNTASASAQRNGSPRYNFDDYVREVPVELFTVSKMVISTTNPKTVNNDTHES